MMQHRLHNGSFAVVLCYHQNHFLFRSDGYIIELFWILAAGAFAVQHSAASGAGRAGRIHYLVGTAFIGHNHDEFIFPIELGGIAGAP